MLVFLLVIAAVVALRGGEELGEIHLSAADAEVRRLDYVAQAGMQRALWQAEQNTCLGDFNIAATNLGGDQYSATAIGTAAGTAYTLPADQDAWIRSDNPSNTGDNDQHIRFEGSNIEQALYRFDLSALPANAQINTASAWFYLEGGKEHPEGPLTVHRVTTDWSEADATWDSINGNVETSVLATIPAQVVGDVWVNINLTAQVQAWMNGQSNYGILLATTAEGIHSEYKSREDASTPPRLEVVVGTGPASPLNIQATGTLANGQTRELTRPIAPAYQPPASVSLQLGVDPGEDTFTDSFYDYRNYGGAAYVQINDNGSDWQQYPLIRFELGSLPRGVSVRSAQLELRTRNLNTPGTATVHQVTRSWVEGTKSGTGQPDGANWYTYDAFNPWASRGGDFNPAAEAETAIDGSETWVSWEIAPLVERWLAGEPNYGLMIRPANGLREAEFSSQEESNVGVAPKLTIEYVCECGNACLAPQGSGTIVMAVVNPTTLVPSDAYKKALFESWGYTVEIISESANQSAFDALAAIGDVFFISETVNANNLGNKLANMSIGVVSQDGSYNSDLGLAGGSAWPVSPAINVSDPSHYITSIFTAGPLDIYSAAMEQLTVSGAAAPELQTLADNGGAGALVALDTGDALFGGGTAAGRRVMLPLGREGRMNWDYLSGNGQLLVQRAIAWAMGADKVSIGNVLLVVVDPGSLTAGEAAKQALIESFDFTVNLIDESDSQASFDAAFADNDVAYIPQDINSTNLGTKLRNATIGVVNEEGEQVDELGIASDKLFKSRQEIDVVDNSHYITETFATGLLTFSTSVQSVHLLDGGAAPGLQVLGKTFNTGSLWKKSLSSLNPGDTLSDGGSAAGRRVHLPWGGGTFDINLLTDDGRTIMLRALEWGAGLDTGIPGLVAHWKLDDAAGLTAVDSAGGNNGTLNNGPAWVSGQLDGALDFDGSNDYVSAGTFDVSGSGLTLTAWFKADVLSDAVDPRIVSKASSTAEADAWWQLSILTSGGNANLRLRTKAGSTTSTLIDSGTNLLAGRWYFATATYDADTGEMKLYLDGTEVASQFHPVGGPVDMGAAVPVAIGANGTAEEFFDGILDDVRVYDRALSPGEIAQLSVPPPLTGDYLDEFNAVAWDGSDGAIDWSAAPWQELGESNGTGSGLVRVLSASQCASSNCLRIGGTEQNLTGRGVTREANLDGVSAATLTFMIAGGGSVTAGLTLSVSNDGGANWTDLQSYTIGSGLPSTPTLESFDISPYASTTTQLRFVGSGTPDDTAYAFIDDVRIEIGGGGGGGGDPPACIFRDEFDNTSYANQDGNAQWAGDWQEVNDGGSPSGGDIQIQGGGNPGNTLRIQDDDRPITRAADLSGHTSATLTLEYKRIGLESGEYVAVSVYDGSTWTELAQFGNPPVGNESDFQPYIQDISMYISPNFQIRLASPPGGMGNADDVNFDNLQIEATGGTTCP